MANLKTFWSSLHRGLRDFSEPIGVIVNSALLLIVYVVGVGLTVLLAKLSKKNFLNLRIDQRRSTYWEDFPMPKNKESYYSQF